MHEVGGHADRDLPEKRSERLHWQNKVGDLISRQQESSIPCIGLEYLVSSVGVYA